MSTYGSRVCAKAQFMFGFLVLAMAVSLPCGTLLAASPAPVDLGVAADFGALAGGAISGTGDVSGDVGSGTGAIAPVITSSGTIYPTGDAFAVAALADFSTAYNDAKDRTHDVLLSAAAYELGGTTLKTGVYRIGAAATLASTVTLDAEGDPDAVFIIQIAGALGTTASVGNVALTNAAQSKNVFWIVEGAVSVGAGSHMEGNILGGAAVAFGATTTMDGRVMAGSTAGTIALAATTISVPVDPSVVGDRVWFDSNGDGIQDPSETTGFANVPVTLLQVVTDSLTIDLGTAADFGALAGGAISGSGNVAGDVGSGTGAIAPAITSDGTIYPTGDPVAVAALADYSTAYNDARKRTSDVLLSAAAYELGGTTLTAGVYKIGAAATLASPVTLDAEGDPDAVFVIQIVGALGTTASAGNVVLTNNAQSANIFWVVEGAVSLGASSHMEGTILGGAAITFGVDTTINGRALAGSAAGTVAMATAISAVTGTPPVGSPPPIVVANTVTDANGNYLFGSVQPSTYIVRWDLSGTTADFRITTAKQGGDDALDSDGVSGDVGGFVYAAEIEVLGGTTHLGVDLGLVETLPAVKLAALNELTTARAAYLDANAYTAENWTALSNARRDGDIAINAATDPAGVAAAKALALAAMDALPTFDETLTAAKAAALDDLAAALAANLEADYTAAEWTARNAAKTAGDSAINAATDPAGVAAAKVLAQVAIDAVPTIAETLAATKAAALDELAAALAANLEADYTPEEWTVLIAAKTAGDSAINAATDPAGVAAAKALAQVAIDAVPTIAETLAATKVAALDELAATLAAYLEANYLTPEEWAALKAAKAAGDTAINASTDPADVTTAKDTALVEMETAVPTIPEPPKFTDISRTPGGEVTLVLSTTPDILVTLQTSTGLNSWTTIATATPATETWTFVHSAVLATGPKRFYRAFVNP